MDSPPALPGTSNIAVSNHTGMNAEVCVRGGTVTAMSVNGLQLLNGAGSVIVPPGHTVAITWSPRHGSGCCSGERTRQSTSGPAVIP